MSQLTSISEGHSTIRHLWTRLVVDSSTLGYIHTYIYTYIHTYIHDGMSTDFSDDSLMFLVSHVRHESRKRTEVPVIGNTKGTCTMKRL